MAVMADQAEQAWQKFSDGIDQAEGVADERDCFLAGWAAATAAHLGAHTAGGAHVCSCGAPVKSD
jgi:hypothetical protein